MKTKLLLFCVMFTVSAFMLNAQPGVADMIHNWTFEDGTATDLIGGANGVLSGATVVDGDLVIDALEEFVELPSAAIGINSYDELTFNIWFDDAAEASSNSGYHMIWYFGDTVGGLGTNGIFLSPARGDNVCRAAISTNIETAPYSYENGANGWEIAGGADTVYNVVTTINSDYIALWINGELIDTANLTDMSGNGKNSIASLSTNVAYIGKGGYTSDPVYQCTVHDFKIYKSVLSDADIATIYANGPDYVGIKNVTNQFSPRVYNANNVIYFKNLNNANVNSVKIYNIVGNMVYGSSEFNGQISHNLPSGVYIVSMDSNLGTYKTKVTVK